MSMLMFNFTGHLAQGSHSGPRSQVQRSFVSGYAATWMYCGYSCEDPRGRPFEGHKLTDWVDCIALSPDDTHIESSSRDCVIRIWEIKSGETSISPLIGHTGLVNSIVYSPDGKRIVSGAHGRMVRLWSSETGNLIADPFARHVDRVYSVMLLINGKQILSGSQDGTICV
jgi:WD40 repeat protein